MSLPSEGEVGECLEMETSVLQDTVWDVNPSDKLPKQQVYQDHECFRWAVLCKAKRPLSFLSGSEQGCAVELSVMIARAIW